MLEYISEQLEWIRPYLVDVEHLVPIKHLRRVTAKKPRKDFTQNQLCHGMITRYARYKRDFKITLYTYFIDITKIHPEVHMRLRPYSKIDTLCFLAHELSHMVHWDHTPQHKSLEAELTHLFMIRLRASGYVSEEEEGEQSWIRHCRQSK